MQIESITRDEVRGIDRWAIEELGLPGLVLMENAARSVADVVVPMLKSRRDRVGVLAGAGNNGGDGFAAARHLMVRDVDVTVFLLASVDKLTGDAAVNLEAIRKLGVPLADCTDFTFVQMKSLWERYAVLVDALGGTGITGPLHGPVAEAVKAANATGVPIVAIDIPTGLICDSGTAQGPAIHAAKTVTLVARKAGFDAIGAKEYTGEVIVADIGVPAVLPRA